MVKRYDGKLSHIENGSYVSYEDYAALQQKLDAIAAENAAMKSGAAKAEKVIMSSKFDYWTDRGELVSAVQKIIQTPVTDALLNSVRAEGVEILTSRLQTLIDEGVFDAKEIGVAAGAVYEGAQIAENLRSGTHDTADKAG